MLHLRNAFRSYLITQSSPARHFTASRSTMVKSEDQVIQVRDIPRSATRADSIVGVQW